MEPLLSKFTSFEEMMKWFNKLDVYLEEPPKDNYMHFIFLTHKAPHYFMIINILNHYYVTNVCYDKDYFYNKLQSIKFTNPQKTRDYLKKKFLKVAQYTARDYSENVDQDVLFHIKCPHKEMKNLKFLEENSDLECGVMYNLLDYFEFGLNVKK